MKNNKCVYIVFSLTLLILLVLLFFVSSPWKKVVIYLIGVNTVMFGQLAKNSFDDIKEQRKNKLLIKNLLESIYQEIKTFKTNYFDPICKKIGEGESKNEPLIDKFPVSHKSFSIYYSNIEIISYVEASIREEILLCYDKFRSLVDIIAKHNNGCDTYTSLLTKKRILNRSIGNMVDGDAVADNRRETQQKKDEMLQNTEFIRKTTNEMKPAIEKTMNNILNFIKPL